MFFNTFGVLADSFGVLTNSLGKLSDSHGVWRSAGRCSAVCPAVDGGQQGSERWTAGSRAADSREGSELWLGGGVFIAKNNIHNKKVMQLFGYYKIIMYLCAVIAKQGYYT